MLIYLVMFCVWPRPSVGPQLRYGATDEESCGEEDDSLIITMKQSPPVNKRADHPTSSVATLVAMLIMGVCNIGSSRRLSIW